MCKGRYFTILVYKRVGKTVIYSNRIREHLIHSLRIYKSEHVVALLQVLERG